MYLINKIEKMNEKVLFLIFVLLSIYTIIHFGYSGIYFPLTHDGLGQINEEIAPLIKFIQRNEFTFENPRQYGPVFMLVLLPFMWLYENKLLFYLSLLMLDYILAGISFYLCFKYIFTMQPSQKKAFWILLIMWLNFNPLMYILGVKNVEIWELLLICTGFVFFIKGKYFGAGLSFAAGTLIKFLPGIFLFYFFFKNRCVFFWSIISLICITALSHFVFGPNMGLSYFSLLVTNVLQSRTWAITFWENTSLKSFVYKLAGGFTQTQSSRYYFVISPQAEHWAFVIASVLQILILIYIVWITVRKEESKEKIMLQFSLVSISMLIISPVTALEYCTLLLFAYSVGLYWILYTNLPKYMYLLYGASYFLIGSIIPFSILVKIIPLIQLNQLLGIETLFPVESYKTLGFPLIGILILGLFFVLAYRKKDIGVWRSKSNE